MVNQVHFYDEQIRRYLLQVVRMFSGFTVKTGKKMNDGVTDYYIKVPARYGDMTRQVANIMKGNSENIVNSCPFIAVYVQSITTDRNRMQEPLFQDKVKVNERKYDSQNGYYIDEKGNSYNVKRMMPVPYNMVLQVDIWTSNTDQKLQLFEQIGVLFNPSLDLQSIDNPLDWTSITTVELQDVTWTSRSIPSGLEDQIDIMTLTFIVPIWINPPALVSRQNIIRNIIHNIYETNNINSLDFDPDAFEFFNSLQKETSVIVTPNNYAVDVYIENGSYFVKPLANGNYDADITWNEVLDNYGLLHDGISRMRLKWHNEIEDLDRDVIGVLYTTSNPQILEFIVDTDTLPTNTLAPVDRIIDPATAKPGFNGVPFAALGQRYLCLGEANSSSVWGISIDSNDIIEYNGIQWVKSFDSSEYTGHAVVTNTYTGQRFKFINNEWQDVFQGIYESGYWRFELLEE